MYKRQVLYGAIIITLGHYVLAIPSDKTFFIGLVLVSIGTGLLKPNISTIVGQLYKPGDLRIDSGYTIFYMSINIGSMLGFLVCGYLGEKVGWHWGFGAAGVGMTFGVLQYIFTKQSLGDAGKNPNLASGEDRSKYLSLFKYVSSLLGLIIISSFLGFWSIDPKLLNKLTVYLILIVAISYFIYLFIFAGLSKVEINYIKMLLLYYLGSVLFWAGFDEGGS